MMFHPPKAFYNRLFLSAKKPLKIAFPVLLLIFLSSCHINKYQYQQPESPSVRIESIVVFGFKLALSEGEEPGISRCPICGATFMAEPVSDSVTGEMTADLFDYLKKLKKYSLIPPEQGRRAYSSILSKGASISITKMLKETGKSFSSDAILFGYIYRWRERTGTSYSISSPASVSFDLHLVGAPDGSVLWKGSFNKTQVSLSENLLDLSTFIRSGGRWLTARELAGIGLEDLIRKSPL